MARQERPGGSSRGSSTSSRSSAARRQRRAQQRQRSVLGVILLVVIALIGFGLLLGIRGLGAAIRPDGSGSAVYTPKVAVIGVADRTALSEVDSTVLKEHEHQAGAVLTGGRCPASGWATLSAGTPVEVSCSFRVTDLGVVDDWAARQAEAARSGGTLGALAGAGQECISAVGPGAALAAARSDGTVADYLDVNAFVTAEYRTSCPVTIIDAGDRTDAIIAALAASDEWTLIVTGVGGAAQAQPIYRLPTTLPGWFTSRATSRTGIVTLADVSHTLRTIVAGVDTTTDPAALKVVENGGVPPTRLTEHVEQTNRLVTPPYGPIAVLGLLFGLGAFVGFGLWWQRRRPRPAPDADGQLDADPAQPDGAAIATTLAALAVLAATLPVGLLAAGAVGWWRTGGPEASLVGSVVIIWIIMAAVAWLGARIAASRVSPESDPAVARRLLVPSTAVVTFAVFLGDAALGGFLHRSSLLAPRPMTQFQGFGGAAMAVLIFSGLALLLLVGRPWWRSLAARLGRPVAGGAAPEPVSRSARARKKRKQPPLPYAVLWRPIAAAAVLVALVLAVVWAARTPTASDVIGFALATLWCAAAGWCLTRTVRHTT